MFDHSFTLDEQVFVGYALYCAVARKYELLTLCRKVDALVSEYHISDSHKSAENEYITALQIYNKFYKTNFTPEGFARWVSVPR